jgi:hypothetical protein
MSAVISLQTSLDLNYPLTASITHKTTPFIWRFVPTTRGPISSVNVAHSLIVQSDYDVCTSCGSLSECPHDADAREGIKALALRGDTADPENTCEMVANAAIAPGEEIFNTYGARLSNAELLVRYGFMLDANDNDILTWTIEEIWDAAGAALADCQPRRWNNEAGYGLCMEILRDWQYDVGWTDSELVIDTELDKNSNPLYMTADGVLSHKLWLAIALATLQRQGTNLGLAQTHQILRSMAWVQTQLERGQTMARSESIDEEDDEYRVRARTVLSPPSFNADLENGKNQIIQPGLNTNL